MRYCLIESLLFHAAFHNLTQDAFLHRCSQGWNNPTGTWPLPAQVCQWYFLLSSSFPPDPQKSPTEVLQQALAGSLLWLLTTLNLPSQRQAEPCTQSLCCQHCAQTQSPPRWHKDGNRELRACRTSLTAGAGTALCCLPPAHRDRILWAPLSQGLKPRATQPPPA